MVNGQGQSSKTLNIKEDIFYISANTMSILMFLVHGYYSVFRGA